MIEENGAPAAEKLFVFYNPPMVNRNLGIRRSYLNETTRVAKELLARKLQTIVFANSRLHTEVLLTYLQQANPPATGRSPSQFADIAAATCRASAAKSSAACAKGGFAAWWRRMRWNWELISARWTPRDGGICRVDRFHMAARGARRAAQRNFVRGAGGVVGAAGSIHRAASGLFFGRSPEHAYVQPDNLEILVNHLKCAAFELPVVAGREIRRRGLARALRAAARSGISASQRRATGTGCRRRIRRTR